MSIKDATFKVSRSNCILDTSKIKKLGLSIPLAKESIEKAIKLYKENEK